MKINGIADLPDNCSLNWNANNIKVRVSLNVERDLVRFIPKNKLHKGKKFWVYWVAKDIPLIKCTPKNIEETYYHLQRVVMINLRNFKKAKLNSQIKSLKSTQLVLDY